MTKPSMINYGGPERGGYALTNRQRAKIENSRMRFISGRVPEKSGGGVDSSNLDLSWREAIQTFGVVGASVLFASSLTLLLKENAPSGITAAQSIGAPNPAEALTALGGATGGAAILVEPIKTGLKNFRGRVSAGYRFGSSSSAGGGMESPPKQCAIYTVKKGDTLWGIAQAKHTTWQTIAADNDLANPRLIHPGQKLKVLCDVGGQELPLSIIEASQVLPNPAIEAAIHNITGGQEGILDVKEAIAGIPTGSVVTLGVDHIFRQNMVAAGDIIRQLDLQTGGKIVILSGLFDKSEQTALDTFNADRAINNYSRIQTIGNLRCSDGSFGELCKILIRAREKDIKVIATGGDIYPVGNDTPEEFLKAVKEADQRTAEIIEKTSQRYPDHTIISMTGPAHNLRGGKWNPGIPTILEAQYQVNKPIYAINLFNPLDAYNGDPFFAIQDKLKGRSVVFAIIYPRWGTKTGMWPEDDEGRGNPGLDMLIMPFLPQ